MNIELSDSCHKFLTYIRKHICPQLPACILYWYVHRQIAHIFVDVRERERKKAFSHRIRLYFSYVYDFLRMIMSNYAHKISQLKWKHKLTSPWGGYDFFFYFYLFFSLQPKCEFDILLIFLPLSLSLCVDDLRRERDVISLIEQFFASSPSLTLNI